MTTIEKRLIDENCHKKHLTCKTEEKKYPGVVQGNPQLKDGVN